MARARCRCAASAVPPGSTKEVSGVSSAFIASISRSSRSTWTPAMRKRPSALAPVFRHAQIGAQIEQVVLDARQHGVQIALGIQPGQADGAVGFVHRADGGDAQARTWRRGCRRPARFRPSRRFWCRFCSSVTMRQT